MEKRIDETAPLLTATDPAPVKVGNVKGQGTILLVCEHAGRRVPARLHGLGLTEAQLSRHIGWDIGAAGLSHNLSAALDARLVSQRYSRLVVDCNRPWGAPDLVPAVSDATAVPGNSGLSDAARCARHRAIHAPFHARITTLIAQQRPAALIAVHSFNPTLGGEVRDMHIGLLFNRDDRLAVALRDVLAPVIGVGLVTLNRPYTVDDASDETIPRHGEATGIPHVLLEVRNDLIADEDGQRRWSDLLARAMTVAVAALG